VLEALANAVRYGCGEDPTKNVEVCVECDEERGMLIIVRDPGEGFDPATLPSPVVGENLYADRGRGIYLINQLMDEVRHERGGTEIWMRKRRPPKDP
jgi:serine/threonine-protein kinase RsbW